MQDKQRNIGGVQKDIRILSYSNLCWIHSIIETVQKCPRNYDKIDGGGGVARITKILYFFLGLSPTRPYMYVNHCCHHHDHHHIFEHCLKVLDRSGTVLPPQKNWSIQKLGKEDKRANRKQLKAISAEIKVSHNFSIRPTFDPISFASAHLPHKGEGQVCISTRLMPIVSHLKFWWSKIWTSSDKLQSFCLQHLPLLLN